MAKYDMCKVMMVEHYSDSDAEAVAVLLSRMPEHPSTSAQDFRAFTAQRFNCGAKDFRVIRRQDQIIALLASTILPESQPPLRHFRILVHPEHRRAGLGSLLMAELRTQSNPAGCISQSNSQRSWAAGNAFLASHGFALQKRELLMRLDKPDEVSIAKVRADVEIRQANPRDHAVWTQLHHLAYQDQDDYSELSPEDIAAEQSKTGFALLIAQIENRVAGYCHVMHLDASEGLINSLVVRKEEQRRGLGRLLLDHATRHLWQDGVACISLNVIATKQGAIGLYEKAGFLCYDELWCYQRANSKARR